MGAFYLVSCLIAVVRNPNTVLKRIGERELPCLVPYLRKNAFDILPLGKLLAVVCHKWFYYIEALR